MDNTVIKNRVGKTPLIRAKNLEKELGLSKIFLKLEGNNPSGHREDRLANILIKDSLSLGKNTICIGIYGVMAESIIFLSSYYCIKCILVLPASNKKIHKNLLSNESVEVVFYGKNEKEALEYSNSLSRQNHWYNANPGIENKLLNMTALSYISEEITSQVEGDIDCIFSQVNYDYSISGLHLGFRRLWIEENINIIPKLYGCSGLEDIPDEKTLREVDDINGKSLTISNDELSKYVKAFKALENIKLDYPNGYSIAGFMKEAELGNLTNANHIIILNNGKIDLDLREISLENSELSKEDIISITDNWLMEYTDPKLEIIEAVDNAFEKGFVVFAYHNNILSGISIIVDLGFEHFATKYHLAYIATNKNVKGRGIATQLLNKAIELTHGNLSLHVEMSNKRAIKLYEKMGFNSSYIRMIHRSKY